MLTSLAPIDGEAILPLAVARVHLNLTADDSFHDAAVQDLRDAAISWAEEYTGRSLQERQFLWELGYFGSPLRLPVAPATTVESIVYADNSDADVELDAAGWLFGTGAVVPAYGSGWPAGRNVRLTFTAGYSTAEDIPPYLLAAVKLAMTAMFENRSSPDMTAAERCADRFRNPVL